MYISSWKYNARQIVIRDKNYRSGESIATCILTPRHPNAIYYPRISIRRLNTVLRTSVYLFTESAVILSSCCVTSRNPRTSFDVEESRRVHTTARRIGYNLHAKTDQPAETQGPEFRGTGAGETKQDRTGTPIGFAFSDCGDGVAVVRQS